MGIALLILSIPAFTYLGLTALAGLPVPEALDFTLNPGRFVFVEVLLFFVAFFSVKSRFRKEKPQRTPSEERSARPRMRKIISVEGMACGHCAMKVESELQDVGGVAYAKVDILTGKARVSGDDLRDGDLIAAVEKAGYRVTGIIGSR